MIPNASGLRIAAASLMFLAVQASAQTIPESPKTVYRCVVSGKTVYQSTPCATTGKSIDIAPGPNAQDIDAARSRAETDKARATPEAAPKADNSSGGGGLKANCGDLRRSRASAVTQRGEAERDKKGAVVDSANKKIQDIDQRFNESGCKPEA
jgi:hypothetical protein